MAHIVLKNQLIRLRTVGEEAFGITLVKIVTVAVRWRRRVGRLKPSSTRANSSIGLFLLSLVFSCH